MNKNAFGITVAVLLLTILALLGVIGSHSPAALAERARREELAKIDPPKAPAVSTQAAPCSVAIFGTKGCQDLERLSVEIDSIRPCAEMATRGMQAQADRCFKETRELERDQRDRIRFREGR